MALISECHVQGTFVGIPQDSHKNALRAGTLAAIIIEKSAHMRRTWANTRVWHLNFRGHWNSNALIDFRSIFFCVTFPASFFSEMKKWFFSSSPLEWSHSLFEIRSFHVNHLSDLSLCNSGYSPLPEVPAPPCFAGSGRSVRRNNCRVILVPAVRCECSLLQIGFQFF